MSKYLVFLFFGGLSSILVGCAQNDIDTTTEEQQEYTIFTDETLGLQLQRPKDWGEITPSKESDFIIFQLPDTTHPGYAREIMRLFFMTFDEYAALPEGSYQGLSDLKQKVIGKNDTYYFLLWMGSEDEDMEDKFLELTAGVSSDTVKEYLINSGFSFFPDQEEKTLIRSLEQADNNLVYRDEEHGFQIQLPPEFQEMKIYTKYARTGTFDRQEYDFVNFTFPRPEEIKNTIPPNRYLPKELASYYDVIRIICIPADQYYAITNWDFGGRAYLEESTFGHNNAYYFIITMGNMARDGLNDLFPQWNEQQYGEASLCEEIGEINIGCRLWNAFTKQFSIFDI